MPRSRFARCHALAHAPLGTLALLCLAACTPAARGPAATATPTSHVMPARVPSGWKVLTTPQFGLAYPPDWALAVDTLTGTPQYYIKSPDHQVRLNVGASPSSDPPNVAHAQFCHPTPTPVGTPITQQFHPTTLAGLPMQYQLVPYANGMMRSWEFWNAQYTIFSLVAFDGDASAAIQAQDEAILATFRPDDATPVQCWEPAFAVSPPNCNGVTQLRIAFPARQWSRRTPWSFLDSRALRETTSIFTPHKLQLTGCMPAGYLISAYGNIPRRWAAIRWIAEGVTFRRGLGGVM